MDRESIILLSAEALYQERILLESKIIPAIKNSTLLSKNEKKAKLKKAKDRLNQIVADLNSIGK